MARFEEGHAWAKMASALLDRAGDGHDLLRAWLYTNEAAIYFQEHQLARALELAKRAVALKEKILRPDHPDLGGSLNNEANALTLLGRPDEALRLNERAYEIFVRAYGPVSLEAGYSLNNLGESLIALDRPQEAIELLSTALTTFEAQMGHDHLYVGYPLTALGRALLALSRPKDAIPPLERALRVRTANEPDPSFVAETRFVLARALWDANADRARARELATTARAAYLKAADSKDAAEIDAWLATRARP